MLHLFEVTPEVTGNIIASYFSVGRSDDTRQTPVRGSGGWEGFYEHGESMFWSLLPLLDPGDTAVGGERYPVVPWVLPDTTTSTTSGTCNNWLRNTVLVISKWDTVNSQKNLSGNVSFLRDADFKEI